MKREPSEWEKITAREATDKELISMEKEMATHSSILAWEIPGIEEPGRLRSMGSQRVRHGLATKHFLVRYISRQKTAYKY